MLNSKVAFVTGGSRGIGAAIAVRLAREGAAVALTYARSKDAADEVVRAIQEEGGRAVAILADSAREGAIIRGMREAVEVFGGLDILVNNAAVKLSGDVSDFSMKDLDLMIAVNIKGVVTAVQEALLHMGRDGRIINIGSISSDYMPMPGHAIYAMTKAAIAGLTRGLVRDLGPRGITVNNVQPGRVETVMLRSALGSSLDAVKAAIPLQRLGRPEEVAAMVAFLAGPESGFVNGAHLRVDGGLSA
ncbi:MAG: 3-oxoacyl-ACP reductase family protein [Janthinobacterium lividum]